MPIYAQWKWIEKTQTFLLVIHFDAVPLGEIGSKSNLRAEEMTISDPIGNHNTLLYVPYNEKLSNQRELHKRTVVTWATTHVEAGLLTELLGYANIINGFKVPTRQGLRSKLVASVEDHSEELTQETVNLIRQEFENKRFILVGFNKGYLVVCFELCTEYLNYLRKLINQFMK